MAWDYSKIIGRIMEKRLEDGLEKQHLADLAGLHPSSITGWQKDPGSDNAQGPTVETLFLLFHRTGWSLDEIVLDRNPEFGAAEREAARSLMKLPSKTRAALLRFIEILARDTHKAAVCPSEESAALKAGLIRATSPGVKSQPHPPFPRQKNAPPAATDAKGPTTS